MDEIDEREIIILPVDNIFFIPSKKKIELLRQEFETDKYNFIFMCKECKKKYKDLFNASVCLHPQYYNNIKSNL